MFRFPAFLNGPLRRTRTLCYLAQTPVWSESSMDEHNLYFARSPIIGFLAVETWRVKTELIIITILHIIIITTSILNLGSKTFAPKILAHTTCINVYWKYIQIFSSINQAKLIAKSGKTYCKNNWAELTAKTIKWWRLPKILLYTQKCLLPKNVCAHLQNICAYQNIRFQSNICAHLEISPHTPKYLLTSKYSRLRNIRASKTFTPSKYLRL